MLRVNVLLAAVALQCTGRSSSLPLKFDDVDEDDWNDEYGDWGWRIYEIGEDDFYNDWNDEYGDWDWHLEKIRDSETTSEPQVKEPQNALETPVAEV